MKKLIFLFLFLSSFSVSAQIDYSDSWEDFYSYNNVKDFVKVDNIIYALVDNAIFTFNETTLETKKLSSIQGLSGETTSSIHYNATSKRLIIGYQNGLIEVIDENESVTISSDIINFNQTGEKSINHISEFGNTLYLSTPFAIVEYDIEKLEFGDTFFIGNGSASLIINKTVISDGKIYAVTEDGIFIATVSSNLLIDFKNWQQIDDSDDRNFINISVFNNKVYFTEGTRLFQLDNGVLIQVRDFFGTIIGLKSSSTNLTVALNKKAIVLDLTESKVAEFSSNLDFDFTLLNAFF